MQNFLTRLVTLICFVELITSTILPLAGSKSDNLKRPSSHLRKTKASYDELEQKFDELDQFTRSGGVKYEDRLWGIASLGLYGQVKTKFAYEELQKVAATRRGLATTVCELGFMAGASSAFASEV